MARFDVTFLGKVATVLLMFAIPGFLLGDSDFPAHERSGVDLGLDRRHPRVSCLSLYDGDRLRLRKIRAGRARPAGARA